MTHEATWEIYGDETAGTEVVRVVTCAASGKWAVEGYWGPEAALRELDDKCKPARHICLTAQTWRPEKP